VVLATQNVDGLHGRAADDESGVRGAPPPAPSAVLELHGSLFRVRCTLCPYAAAHDGPVDASDRATLPRCPMCGALLRPGVVWFGEPLEAPVLAAAMRAAERADACLVVGTSAVVQPAASLAAITREAGGRVIEVNPESTPLTALADEVLRGAAGELLPQIL
jgi:NAD-dependent deacetylase